MTRPSKLPADMLLKIFKILLSLVFKGISSCNLMHGRHKFNTLYLLFLTIYSRICLYKSLCLYFAYGISSNNLVSNINKSMTLCTTYLISVNRIVCEILPLVSCRNGKQSRNFSRHRN